MKKREKTKCVHFCVIFENERSLSFFDFSFAPKFDSFVCIFGSYFRTNAPANHCLGCGIAVGNRLC